MEILAPHVLSPEFDENTKPEGLVNSFESYSSDQKSNQMVVTILGNDIPMEDTESMKYYPRKDYPFVCWWTFYLASQPLCNTADMC